MTKQYLLVLLGITSSAQRFSDGLAMACKRQFLILNLLAWAWAKHEPEKVLIQHCSSKSVSDANLLLSSLSLAQIFLETKSRSFSPNSKGALVAVAAL